MYMYRIIVCIIINSMLKAAKRKYEHKTFVCTYLPSLEYLAFVLSVEWAGVVSR